MSASTYSEASSQDQVLTQQRPSSSSTSKYHHHYLHCDGVQTGQQPSQQTSRQEQLLVIATPNSKRCLPAICPVNASQEKAIGYGAFGVVWSVADPRDGKKLALKKIPNVFQNIIAAKRAHRELSFLHRLRNDNIVSIVGVLEEPNFPHEIYLLCDLMQTDLHKIIVSPQSLSVDHVKIFLYQILRGLKFLHSANILHRDIKPGNLLVNSDCKLKICDFGLARVHDPNSEGTRWLTLEVVTQYYRAPELLMGAQEYSAAIDIWSAGCIFAELLSRTILFQANNPLSQLDLIMELLGTPDPTDLSSACSAARRHVLRLPRRRAKLASTLWSTSRTVTDDGLHLLEQLLRFNPKHRISATTALTHPYLSDARVRYHSCMCSCCPPRGGGGSSSSSSFSSSSSSSCSSSSYSESHQHQSQASDSLEPTCQAPLTDVEQLEATMVDSLSATSRLQELARRINAADSRNRCATLRLNRHAVNFRTFIKSSVAQVSERAPSPHRWENQ